MANELVERIKCDKEKVRLGLANNLLFIIAYDNYHVGLMLIVGYSNALEEMSK